MIIVYYSTSQKNDITIFARHFNGCHQGRTKWRNCRLTPQTPDYQLGWAVLAASRLLDTLKWNFQFMEWNFSQPMICNIKGTYHTELVWGSSTSFFLAMHESFFSQETFRGQKWLIFVVRSFALFLQIKTKKAFSLKLKGCTVNDKTYRLDLYAFGLHLALNSFAQSIRVFFKGFATFSLCFSDPWTTRPTL